MVQKYGGIEFSIVASPESLYSLVDRFPVLVVKEIRDLSDPVHGLDLDLDHFGFIGGDDVIHGAHVAPWLDPDHVSGLDLHSSDVIGGWTDFVGADGAH